MRSASGLMVVLFALAACGKNSPGGRPTGTGGTTGSGGMVGASGNGVSGMGASGTGGTGTGGGGSQPAPGCEAADATVTGSAAHAGALSVLNQMVPCGIGLCHAGMGQANLVLLGVTDLKATLVGKAACEAPALMLVDPQGGNAALANSWLWQKLSAPAMSTDALIVQPTWGTPGACPTMGFGPTQTSGFGNRMPYGGGVLAAQPLAQIRNWICAGAPGP